MRVTVSNARPTIFVVDDDAAVRDALKLLLRSVGQAVETYSSGQEFIDAYSEDRSGCLVLDIRMPGMSGLELQQKLNERHSILPIIFITGHGDVPMAVEAMQAGAVDFIQKPFRDQDLIDRINPFGEAYAILAKTMSEESLKQVQTAISAKRTSLTMEEARELAKRALRFKHERGRLPSITSADAWEKRMAEGVAYLARMKAEAARG